MTGGHPDVIIIGAGVVGLFTARELARAGLEVCVLEQGGASLEASWAAGGILAPLLPWQNPAAVQALYQRSRRLYPEIAHELLERTGIDPEYRRCGLLALEPDELDRARRWGLAAHETVEFLQPSEVARRFPGVACAGTAIHLPDVAQIRNPRLLKALRSSLAAAGVRILDNQVVRSIKLVQGRVSGVMLESGALSAGCVVVAAGAWSAMLLDTLSIKLAVQPVKGQMLLYAPQAMPGVILFGQDHYLVPRCDGRILAGSTLEECGFDKSATPEARASLAAAAQRLYPALQNALIEQHWTGLRPGSPDGVPFIGPCAEVPGLYLNTGHFRHGVTTAPASAELLSEMILKQAASAGKPPVPC